jgi:hypothetical protein
MFNVFGIEEMQGVFIAEKKHWRKLYNTYLCEFYSSSYCDQIKKDEIVGYVMCGMEKNM